MKKFLVMVSLLLMCGLIAFAGGQQEGGGGAGEGMDDGAVKDQNKAVTITVATGSNPGTLRNNMALKFRDEINAMPELNIKLNIVEGHSLGTASDMMDQVSDNSIQMFAMDAVWLVPYDPDLQPLSFGFVFRDREHMQKFFESEVFKEIADRIAKANNIRALKPVALTSRDYFSNTPLKNSEDLINLKMRSPKLEMFVETYKAYGMKPTTIDWSEIFLSLKSGVANAAQGPFGDVLPNKWHLAAPYITKFGDIFSNQSWNINEQTWQSLSEAQKEGVLKACESANQFGLLEHLKEEQEILNQMIAEGAQYMGGLEDPEVVRAKALESAKKLEAAGKWSAGLIDRIDQIQ